MNVPVPFVAAEALQRRLVPAATDLDGALQELARTVGELLGALPVTLVAVVVGLGVWRLRFPFAGAVAAGSIHLAAATGLWSATAATALHATLVALLAWPLAAVARWTARSAPRLPAALRRRQVLVPLVSALVPVGLTGWAILLGRTWVLAAVAATALAAAVGAAAPHDRFPRMLPTLLVSLAVVLLAGMLGGPGLGADLVRAVPTGEIRDSLATAVAIAALIALTTAVASTSGRDPAASATGSDVSDAPTARRPLAQEPA
ncbi:hypothetical protein [Egicoccus halophilus]|uniref:Uncharacterized protein n=1 Tax=Egicoccus halophilus TaxID=1670830 RepID=A0A8J3EVR0_9ACTN|nr:hypothetical protein [Egicoccus halophilus]GGI09674.1 hypothetical protein GCM10011354_35250 [Egicoccus halophilus]